MTIDHDYTVCLRRLREEDGGGYLACIPQLGIGAFNGVGETPEEALQNLAHLYEWLREKWLKEGRSEDLFPAPLTECDLYFNWSGNR